MSLRNSQKITGISIFAIAALLFFTSCQKSADIPSKGSSKLTFYLTDAPGDYKAVWVDIQQVMVKVNSDSANENGWIEAPLVRPGKYNLLDFRNGKDTILAAADIPAGTVSQIRLILGEDNSLVLSDSTSVDLKTPSAQQSGLKLNVHAELKQGIPYALVLDFDAARSVVEAGKSGNYLLKPVIRTFAKEAGGAIEGVVLPDSARAHVMAINGADTLSSIPDSSGYYKFWGMPAGGYQLIFAADTTTLYHSDTLNNITVTEGEVTKVDTVWLKK